MKCKVLSDGKRINGKGRITVKICNKMQNYFGMAICQNTAEAWNNEQAKALYSMKKGVPAVLWHCTDQPDIGDRHKSVQGNRIVGVNISKQSKTINLLSVCQ